jgi:hypothetical protein
MVQSQNSAHPEGVSGNANGTANSVATARHRKATAAIGMRLAGATWNEIAHALGYPTARQALVATERALSKELAADDRDKMRKLAGARLDRLLRSAWPKAINPDHPEHLQALAKCREVIGDHRKLFGLDAPTEVIVHNPTQAELDAWVAQVLNLTTPQVAEYDIFEGEVVDDADDSAEEQRALPPGQ